MFSFHFKEHPTAKLYEQHLLGKRWALSFVTVGELLLWAKLKNWGSARVAKLEASIARTGVIPYDLELCQTYAELRAQLERAGRPVPANDLWIASTAVRHSIPLVSHNRKDYDAIPGLVLISETPKALKLQMEIDETGPSAT